MTLETFADKYRLRLKKDDCRDPYIPAKYGQIYYWGKGLLGVLFMPGEKHPSTWGHAKRVGVKAGFRVSQNGDGEGAMVFTGSNHEQARLAIKLVGAQRRRRVGPENVTRLQAASKNQALA